jgi:O-antigen/teichoic acid export membrane protein
LGQAVLVGLGEFPKSSYAAICAAVIKIATIAWLLLTGGTLLNVAWAWVGASTLGASVNLAAMAHGLRGKKADAIQPGVLPLGGLVEPITFVAISILLTFEAQADTLVLSAFRTSAEIGFYGAATTIAFAFLVLSQGFRLSVYPVMARLARDNDLRLHQLYDESVGYLGVVGIGLAIVLWFSSSSLVQLLFGSAFSNSAAPLRILGLAIALIFLNEPSSRLLLAKQQQRRLLVTIALATAFNVASNLLLIPRWGALGAAYARTISSGAILILTLCNLRGITSIRPVLLRMTVPVVAGIIAVSASPLTNRLSGWSQVAAVMLIYAVALVLLRRLRLPAPGR